MILGNVLLETMVSAMYRDKNSLVNDSFQTSCLTIRHTAD